MGNRLKKIYLAADWGTTRLLAYMNPREYWARASVRWYRLAADQGHAKAQVNLGFAYTEGQGVPQDDQEAVRWTR